MVGVGDVLGVVGDAFQALVVEDVVDAYGLLGFAVGVHETAAALLEAIDEVAQHGVVGEL